LLLRNWLVMIHLVHLIKTKKQNRKKELKNKSIEPNSSLLDSIDRIGNFLFLSGSKQLSLHVKIRLSVTPGAYEKVNTYISSFLSSRLEYVSITRASVDLRITETNLETQCTKEVTLTKEYRDYIQIELEKQPEGFPRKKFRGQKYIQIRNGVEVEYDDFDDEFKENLKRNFGKF